MLRFRVRNPSSPQTIRLHATTFDARKPNLSIVEAPPFKNGGFTMTLSRLFQGAMPPERHLLNKVFAADLFPVPPCLRN